MLSYPSGMTVSSRALGLLADALRAHRNQRATRWRKLSAGRQALLVVAYLRKGETYADLACGFEIGTSTVYRYVREALALLAAMAPTLSPNFVNRINSTWVENSGRHLMWMTPDEIAAELRTYIAKGIDFIKYAANEHGGQSLLFFQGISELIKRVAIMRGDIPDPFEQTMHPAEAEAERLLADIKPDS